MNTPIFDFLQNYSRSNTLRCHMPGHKGIGFPLPFSFDITEINGADSLFEADGIISQSEKIMSSLYGTQSTVYSAGGSTLCIQAMLKIVKDEGRKVFAVRNVHRSFLNACALFDIDVQWIIPDYTDGILSGTIDLQKVESLLSKETAPSCLYVTSPDYTGKIADIQSLAQICHRYGSVLVVDNAHGSHLHFFDKSIHPIYLGADMCCDSAHKMLPALTGGAMLHTSSKKYAPLLKNAMSITGSTSPSYLVLLSLDLCNRYIYESIRSDIKVGTQSISTLKARFSQSLIFSDGDPFHITVKASECGLNGNELADELRNNGVECEYSDSRILVLLMSPLNTQADYIRLSSALEKSLKNVKKYPPSESRFTMSLPQKAMSIREAVFSPQEEIPVECAEGRVCASVKVPCPPAIPIVASGEVVNSESIVLFKKYGIKSIIAVKDMR